MPKLPCIGAFPLHLLLSHISMVFPVDICLAAAMIHILSCPFLMQLKSILSMYLILCASVNRFGRYGDVSKKAVKWSPKLVSISLSDADRSTVKKGLIGPARNVFCGS